MTVLFVVLSFFYLRPATVELLRGNSAVMIGDNTDSVTNPWAFRLVVDVSRSRPWDLLFAAIYSDQINSPEGTASYVTFIERIFVVLYSPFVRTDAMPTLIVWSLMVMTGVSCHAFGRVLGWPRAVAFAIAIAWAICPFTRGRSVVHAGMVGMYWAPFLFMALHLLARPPKHLSVRQATVLAAVLVLFAVFAGHYFVMISALLSPIYFLYYWWLLPRAASRAGALGRLAIAIAPAVLFLGWCVVMTLPSYGARALAKVVVTRTETDYMLREGGAHPSDYVTGDTKFGDRDLNPVRSALTRRARATIGQNHHERAQGIRWPVLAGCAALAVALCVRRFRRRLSRTERRLGVFVFVLGTVAFLFSLSPHGLRVYDKDLGPFQYVARVFPRFRVPNRVGTLVQFAAMIGGGVLMSRVLRKHLHKRTVASAALSFALPALMVLDYWPLHAVTMAPVPRRRVELEAGGVCGGGMSVPYVTNGYYDEDYYRLQAELRGTSCKLLHASAMTDEDLTIRNALGRPMGDGTDRLRAERLARCAGASWVVFRLDAGKDLKESFCREMGWTFVSDDSCRAPPKRAEEMPVLRPVRECLDQLVVRSQ